MHLLWERELLQETAPWSWRLCWKCQELQSCCPSPAGINKPGEWSPSAAWPRGCPCPTEPGQPLMGAPCVSWAVQGLHRRALHEPLSCRAAGDRVLMLTWVYECHRWRIRMSWQVQNVIRQAQCSVPAITHCPIPEAAHTAAAAPHSWGLLC